MTNRNTTLLIIALTIMAVLLGINYFTTPFYNWFDNLNFLDNETHEEVTEEEEDVRRQQLLQTLTPEQKIAQLIAYPLTIETANDLEQEQDEQVEDEKDERLDKNSDQENDEGADKNSDQENDEGAAREQSETGSTSASVKRITDFEPGFITIFGSGISFDQAAATTQTITRNFEDKPLNPLFAVDHEGGSVQRLSGEGFLQLPPWRELCQVEEEVFLDRVTQSAEELQGAGINIVFAPVLDLGGKALGDRTCNDFEQLVYSANDFIKTFGFHRIMPVLKHYPGLGNTNRDLHQEPDEIRLDPDDIGVFSKFLSVYPNIGVMTTHVSLVDRFEGMPCSLSEICLNVFSERWPDVLLFSDALNMGALESLIQSEDMAKEQSSTQSAQINFDSDVDSDADSNEENNSNTSMDADQDTTQSSDGNSAVFRDITDIAKQAIIAGNDVLTFGPGVSDEELKSILAGLAQAYRTDTNFARLVDEKVEKIVSLKAIN